MNSEKEIIALKEEQRMALASNAMECLHQNLCDAGCSKEQVNYPPPTLSAKRRGLRAAYAHTGQTLARCPV